MTVIKKYQLFMENIKQDNMWSIIPESIKELHLLFKQNGKSLYCVGGAIRDFLNGEKPKDFDLCTDATPDEVLQILGKKYRTNLQGKSFGIVVVYTNDEPKGIEIATFREDIYDDKLGITRNPDVKFSTIENDVKRRDIPYNSLFFDLDNHEIVDLVGGIECIKNKITKFVGDPILRIKEDPLRILRLLRFNCRYQFIIDSNTAEAIKENSDQLKIISRERIWDLKSDNPGEMFKAWKQAKDYSEYLEYFNQFNLWEDIFQNTKVNTLIEKSKYYEIYIANIFYFEDIDTLSNKLVLDYKIDIDFTRKVVYLLSFLKFIETEDYSMVPDLYKKSRIANVSDDILTEWFDLKGMNDERILLNAFLKYKPSVSSEELMNKGFKGKALGDEIKRLEIEKFKELL